MKNLETILFFGIATALLVSILSFCYLTYPTYQPITRP